MAPSARRCGGYAAARMRSAGRLRRDEASAASRYVGRGAAGGAAVLPGVFRPGAVRRAASPGRPTTRWADTSGKPVIVVTGAPATQLRRSAAVPDRRWYSPSLTLLRGDLVGWLSDEDAVVPRELIYPPDRSQQQVDERERRGLRRLAVRGADRRA